MQPIDRRAFIGLAAAAAVGSAGAAQGTPLHVRRIPSSGEALPVIGLGTWQTFDVGTTAAERAPLRQVLARFVELGGRVIDSSPMYGESETVVGDLARELGIRDRLFVATKVWIRGKAQGIRQMETSMSRLQVATCDLMQVHNLLDVDAHLDTLAEWRRAGRVRHVGITHYTASAHDEIRAVLERRPVDFVQVNFSVGERDAERRLLPFARDRGIAVIVNRPFAGGELLRRLAGTPLPTWAVELDCHSWAQLLLKFVLAHPAVTCAIPATSRVRHLEDNLLAGTGRLPDETLRERIAQAVLAR